MPQDIFLLIYKLYIVHTIFKYLIKLWKFYIYSFKKYLDNKNTTLRLNLPEIISSGYKNDQSYF